LLHPFFAAHYSEKNLNRIASLAVSDLDSAEHLWGGRDSSLSFRNVLVGPPDQRGEIWQAWISSGEITLAEESRYYAVHHVQELEGKRIDRWALYGAVAVDDPALFIHEDVFPEGVERARQSTEACESDMAPIFIGCEEASGETLRFLLESYCTRSEPMIRFVESVSSVHWVWEIKDKSVESDLRKLFSSAPLFLLDGHHRLAAARENSRLGIGDRMILACVCSMGASDTLILPIHRAVYSERWILTDALEADLARFGCKLSELSRVNPGSIQDTLDRIAAGDPACVVLHGHSARPLLLQFPTMSQLHPSLAKLSVACLDHGLLASHQEARAIPVASLPMALEQLALDQAQVAFFLPPIPSAQVRAVASAHLKMPRKSTRFVPKPALGLICRPWGANAG
jgi:hypothetical protein